MAGGKVLATLKVIASILLSSFLSFILAYSVYGDNSNSIESVYEAKALIIRVFPDPWGPKSKK